MLTITHWQLTLDYGTLTTAEQEIRQDKTQLKPFLGGRGWGGDIGPYGYQR